MISANVISHNFPLYLRGKKLDLGKWWAGNMFSPRPGEKEVKMGGLRLP
jgi:hypothetical protein